MKMVTTIVPVFSYLERVTQLRSQVDIKRGLFIRQNKPLSDVFDNPGAILSAILPNVFILSSVILLMLLIFGAYTIISSAGNPEQKQKGSQTVTGAIIGFAIVFTSYWVLQILEIITGINFLNATLPGLG